MRQQNHSVALLLIYLQKWSNKKVILSLLLYIILKGVGRAADMYAIGVLLYEML